MNKALSFQSPEDIRAFQDEQLLAQLDYVMQHSPFYKRHFAGLEMNALHGWDDLQHLPVTTKSDLQLNNMDFLCVDRSRIIDYITTSGTTGTPVTFAVTDKDLERLADNEHASFVCAGGSKEDIYQLMLTLDRRFMAGLAYFLGLRKLGAGIIRVGPGNAVLQFDTMERVNPTVLVTLPSFLLKLIEYAEKNGIDLNASSVRSAVCIGEPIRDSQFRLSKLGKRITEKWDIKLFSTYASTEMGAAFTECDAGQGGHLNPEIIVLEFLDEQNRRVKEGQLGEVCITNLGVEGMPLVRFKTGDICHHYTEACACGRNTLRLGPIVGRKNQMIKYKGTTLFPTAFYEILNEMEEVENYQVEVRTNNIDTDDILVILGCRAPRPALEKNIKDHFRAKLRVAPEIKFLDPREVHALLHPNMSRKPFTFADKRKAKD